MPDNRLTTKMYSIKDTKQGVCFPPFCTPNDIEACRKVGMMTMDQNTQLYHYPADFQLFNVGEFCTESGSVVSNDVRFVANVLDIHSEIRGNR